MRLANRMLSRTGLGIALLSLAATGAQADLQFSGTLDGGYTSSWLGSHQANSWNADGALLINFDPSNWNAQASFGYQNLGGSTSLYDYAGDVFWRDGDGLLGATAAGKTIGSAPAIWTFGGFGERYFECWTGAIKAGGLTGPQGTSGWYVGGRAVGYLTPNLALDGSVDYLSVNGGSGGSSGSASDTLLTAGGEYLVSQDVPISVGAHYTYLTLGGSGLGGSGGGSLNEFSVQLKLYLDGPPGSPLIERQRAAPVSWDDRVRFLGGG